MLVTARSRGAGAEEWLVPMMGGLQAVYAREIKLWRRFLEIDEVVAALGRAVAPRPPTQEERIFMTSHQGLRTLAKAAD